MSDPSVSLSDVFALQAGQGMEKVREQLSKELKGVQWTASLPDVAKKVAGLFDIGISDIMVAGWKKLNELKKFLDQSKYDPDETVYVELSEHTVESEHHPSVEIEVNGVSVKKLEFTVTLSITLKSFILEIRNGRIKGIQTGTCEAKGTLAFEDLVLAEKPFAPIKLPGSIDLGEGVALAA